MTESFSRQEKLKSRNRIDDLFKKGKRIRKGKVILVYLPCESDLEYSQVGFSVPKKKIKKAVQRNTIKRRFREAYRRNKNILDSASTRFSMMFIYSGNDSSTQEEINNATVSILRQVGEKFKK